MMTLHRVSWLLAVVGCSGSTVAPSDAGPVAAASASVVVPPPPSPPASVPCIDLPPLPKPVTGASAARLADGRLLVTGGEDDVPRPTTRAWFLDLAARTVSPAPPLPKARAEHVSVSLRDGRVLVIGASARLPLGQEPLLVYHPVHNAWSSVPTKRVIPQDAAVTLLPDGRVLVAGGIVPDPSGRHQNYVDLAFFFDPAKNTVVAAPSLPQAGVYLSNGVHDDHVELRGAAGQSPGPGKMAVFDVDAGAWGLLDNGFPQPAVVPEGALELPEGRLELLSSKITWCPRSR